jgi:HSP20 family protein
LTNLDRQVEDLFAELIELPWKGMASGTAWQPDIDVYESDDAYLIVADLPGVPTDHLIVSVEQNRIAIRGQRMETKREQSSKRLTVERRYGEFAREFSFRSPVDPGAVSVTHAEGVFQIRVPKRQRRLET